MKYELKEDGALLRNGVLVARLQGTGELALSEMLALRKDVAQRLAEPELPPGTALVTLQFTSEDLVGIAAQYGHFLTPEHASAILLSESAGNWATLLWGAVGSAVKDFER